ncbi:MULTISPECIES: hypothetical protein [Arenibacter]|uniref:Uncharacterized protein n=1 Tax=Arenibacter arenosicollis TaxID=2762274 RepID=A0ABR7QQD3_9FLAO|nr:MULTISPECIES: hypothetical protein [Arenibacter]MBC8769402.1 hypothetical protein [Arenibacter arenosicollis]PXX25685.1 hypothetical protein C7972_111103 [Arenibacter sp. ARW7G5Y1]|tara:strand:- start:2076 stop:2522 length:447 start_codon:yes stop_codon:yes gene_type:complete
MGKQKKITTLDLLEQMANKNQETSSTLEQLKLDRMGLKQQTTSLNVRKEDAINKLEKNRKPKEESPSENNHNIGKQLDVLLQTDKLKNKKETFFMTINSDCAMKYEKLAMGISYKMGVKTSRNDLIRKVLLDFTNRNYEKLITLIEQK